MEITKDYYIVARLHRKMMAESPNIGMLAFPVECEVDLTSCANNCAGAFLVFTSLEDAKAEAGDCEIFVFYGTEKNETSKEKLS